MSCEYNLSNNEDVFLSYSHDDRLLVERIAEFISEAGFSCWIDKEQLRAGTKYNSAIDCAIDKAIVFIAFLSKTYVNKEYCIHEFDRAIDKHLSILAVCIDDVTESTNKQNAYLFSFNAGRNLLGFKSRVNENNSDDIETFANGIISSVPLVQLKKYNISGDEEDYPPVTTPDYIFDCLRLYHQEQYTQDGNYALNEIRSELFPAIENPEINVMYKDDDKKDVSLVKLFSEVDGQSDYIKHILITGEGGIGKTVTLLKTCEYLLEKKTNAIYVPLSKIDANMNLDQYLECYVCKGNQRIWRDIQYLMSAPYTSSPNVVLLLDGINEVPLKYIETLVKIDIMKYVDAFPNVKLVMTSRWYDNSLMHSLKKNIILLEMQTLDREAIDLYLQTMGISSVIDEKIYTVIKTPLMLTLFADVEKHKEKYQNVEGIVLEDNPDTPGKILGNFFQTQLFRASEEKPLDKGEYIALIEYLLPKIAFSMLMNQSQYIRQSDLRKCINEIKKEEERFTWYKDQWDWTIAGRNSIDAGKLLGIVFTDLHFLNKSDEGYEFLHPVFRDYFAAYFLANELWAYEEDNDRFSEENSLFGNCIFSNDILNYVSDIVREETARPIQQNDTWVFPGKKDIRPSKNSVVESVLSLWREKNSDAAQNAVANLVKIMQIGRQNLLAWCDFSNLDLRKCWLNQCQFTVWHKDEYYPSIFDGAWINRENFLTDGHESKISAILFDGQSCVFTGDITGVVRFYNIAEQSWTHSVQLQCRPVIDFAWDSDHKLLAIMYENIVFCYSVEEKKVVDSHGNSSKNRNFRYVQFSKNNEINVTFDLEPLIWCDVYGNKLSSELSYDVPARCAQWNPHRKEFIRSTMFQQLSVARFDESTLSWKLPPALQQKLDDYNRLYKESAEKMKTTQYLSLRDLGATESKSICCIQYNENGSKILVAVQNLLVEYDAESFEILNRKVFSGYIQCACYLNSGVAVGAGSDLILLDANFSEESILHGSQIQSIETVIEDLEGNGYYILSSNGEVKKLNHELIVQNMRFTERKNGIVWARDRLTNNIQMAFLPWDKFPFGARYSYETNYFEPLGWRYEFVDVPESSDDDGQRYYKMDSSLLVLEQLPPYRKIIYPNYTGIWIFGCSFDDIRGDMNNHRDLSFLIQNGGIIHDTNE